jgi:acetyl esterase/lipase
MIRAASMALACLVAQYTVACAQTPDTGRTMIQFSELTSAPFAPADLREQYGPGPQQFGELRLPTTAPGKRPVVVLVHGGCWRSAYSLAHDAPAATALAQAGYVVWLPEYRRIGDPGGGWPGTFDDVALAIDHVRLLAARYPAIDTNRVVLAGHSAGGELVMWAAARRTGIRTPGLEATATPLKPAGVLSLAGVLDLAAFGASPGGCNSSVSLLVGGSPSEHADRYAAVSPIEAPAVGVPIRLVHGAADPIVPPSQSERFAAHARSLGDRVEATLVPGAGHFDLVAPGAAAWPSVLRALRALLENPGAQK